MTGTKTLTIIKPCAVANGYIGPILVMIGENRFHIAAMKLISLSPAMAEKFYSVHNQKPFFKDLVHFMTSGPVVVAILEKKNAVKAYRKLIGNTNPEKADEGTIRKKYAESIQRNAVHGSDSDENAAQECDFFFAISERYSAFED